jgi:mRNA interferase RelE/StbE
VTSYRVTLRPAARRRLAKLDPIISKRIVAALDALAEDPRPPGVRALTGHHGWLRLRVGDWRMVYEVHDNELHVLVIEIAHRREVYRDI